LWINPPSGNRPLGGPLLSGRIPTAIHPAHALGALFVPRLLLPTLVADDALIMATVRRLGLGCFSGLFFAVLHQQFIADHLPNDLLCLRFGSVVKSGHGNLLPLQTATGRNVSPLRPFRPVPLESCHTTKTSADRPDVRLLGSCAEPTNRSVQVADAVLRQGMHGSFSRGDTLNFTGERPTAG
jgi:hypothetical protein